MKHALALAGRELRSYVLSPITGAVMAICAVASGYFFSTLLVYYVRQSALADGQIEQIGHSDLQLDVPTIMLSEFFKNEGFVLLVIIPFLTIGLVANERRTGAIERLLMPPVRPRHLVAGRFLGAFTLCVIMLSLTVPFHGFLAQGGAWEPGVIAAGYAGLLLLAAAELSVGLLVSSLCTRVLTSAFGTYGILVALYFAHMSAWLGSPAWRDVAGFLSFYLHYADFTRGVVALPDVVYFVTCATLGLFLTARSVGAARDTRLRLEAATGPPAGPQRPFPLSTVIWTILLAGCLALVNALAWYSPVRVDLTASGRNTVSAESREVIAKLPRDVVLRQFGQTRDPRVDQILGTVAASSHHVRQEFVDAGRNPAETRRYGIIKDGTVVVASGSTYRKIEEPTEQALVLAMLDVSDARRRTICFAGGHGEHDPSDEGATGLSRLVSALEASNFTTARVGLLEDRMASRCSAVVVAGPQRDFSQVEGDLLTKFAESARGVAVMIDPAPAAPLLSWLKPWGIIPSRRVIVETSGAEERVGGGPRTVLALTYGSHPIARNFEMATMYDGARPLEMARPAYGGQLVALALTGAGTAEQDEMASDPVRRGPLTLAVAGSFTRPSGPDTAGRAEGRLVAFGDSDFVTNALIDRLGNRDFLLRTISWLAGEDEAVNLPAQERESRRIELAGRTRAWMYLANMGLLPLVPLLAGLAAFIRSRRQRSRAQDRVSAPRSPNPRAS